MGRLAAPLFAAGMAPGKGEYTKDGSIFPDRAGGYDLGGRIMSIRFTAPASKQAPAENAHRAMRPEAARRPESLPNFSC